MFWLYSSLLLVSRQAVQGRAARQRAALEEERRIVEV
jgi:hypothetical protein